jgi:hypothetical protein
VNKLVFVRIIRKKLTMATKIGDIFSIPVKEEMIGFGQVLRKPRYRIYIVVFEELCHMGGIPKVEEIVKFAPLLLGVTLDGRLYNDIWKVVGNYKKNISGFPLPYYKLGTPPETYLVNHKGERLRKAKPLEVEALSYETTLSPIYFDDALKAWHKILPWQEAFDEILYNEVVKKIAVVK